MESNPLDRLFLFFVSGVSLLSFFLLTGCASTGVPRPPSLMLPQVVRTLQAERSGNHIDLRWATPSLSTDRLPLARSKHGAGTLTAELCRVTGTGCVTFTRQLVFAGDSASARDTLSPELASGPPRTIHYRIRILNGTGHAAGWSRDAAAAAGEAPSAITLLAAATTNQGVQLTWQAVPPLPEDRILLQAVTVTRTGQPTRNLTAPAGAGGAIDTAAISGEQIRYTVQRTRTVSLEKQALSLNGEPATVVTTVAKDTFPPLPPRGLAAVAVQMEGSPPEIDLSWAPNTETDLLGYLVYRTELTPAGQGRADGVKDEAARRLTAQPISSVSYRDISVLPGHTYRYTVIAVDRSGNASAPGLPAEERLRETF